MHNVTFICTRTSPTGKAMRRPACELYRNLEQAQEQVLRREYERGILTFLIQVPLPDRLVEKLDTVGRVF